MKKQNESTPSFLDDASGKFPMKKNQVKKEPQYTVVKRNGTLVPFQRDRIFKAVEAAFRDTKKLKGSTVLDPELVQIIQKMTDLVVKQVLHLASKGACLTVEGIQDVVEVTLMKNGHHDVARDYIIYRDNRKANRSDSSLKLKIYRRDKTTPAQFNPMRIASSIEKAFRKARNLLEQTPDDALFAVNHLTQKIVAEMMDLAAKGDLLYVDMIEDRIEKELMLENYFDVAKHYILYRAEKEKKQDAFPSIPYGVDENTSMRHFEITTQDLQKITLTEAMVRGKMAFAARGLESLVSVQELVDTALSQFYSNMKEKEVDLAYIFAAKSKIEKEPAYSQVAARILLDCLYRETLDLPASDRSLQKTHQTYFKKYIKKAIAVERLSPQLLEFDLDLLAEAMDLSRDDIFTYLGLQTLYDRYFIHHDNQRMETPQIFWMRVAMGLALGEKENKNERAIEFYHILSQFYFTSSTPTLFNAGTCHSQLSSCYLSTVNDDLYHIFKLIGDDAQLSKWAGGIGNDWTNIRATGSRIKGTNGVSQGVIPFLKVANDTAVAVNQCFAPDTSLYTGQGIKPISDVKVGDLVLGISGTYREVTEKFAYNQKGPMVSLRTQYSLEPLSVTTGHPFYAIRNVPTNESVQTCNSEWIDAGELQTGDYIAQVIPQEVIKVAEFTEEDARLYGIFLNHGKISQDQTIWTLSIPSESNSRLDFVRDYLKAKDIHCWETKEENNVLHLHWANPQHAVCDATTGQATESSDSAFPFNEQDVYTSQNEKYISPRLAHLPHHQTLALVQGLLEETYALSHDQQIVFSHSSRQLIEGLRYQCLRLGVPTSRHEVYDLQIPATAPIAERLNLSTTSKEDWITSDQYLFTRVTEVQSISSTPFVYDLKVEGDESYMTTAGLAHNGGKRKGAMCAYLETWHLDIEDFLELRKNTGDERRRTHDMNTANWIPDLFMKRVKANQGWTLFSPSDVPDLHDLYGARFEERYKEYETMAEEGKIKLFKKIDALQLWRKMLSMLFETGHPWITFKDPSNIRSPQSHVGVVHSSNLCTEILLNTSETETAVCNLGSINLAKHVNEKGLDEELLKTTIRTAIRMLDNVVDINFYPTPEAKNSNLLHRPIGLGIMGFQDALYIQNISYASHEAVTFSDRCMEMISYYAILSSSELAQEKGTYSSYKGSKWDLGLLPIDTIDLLEKERGSPIQVDRSSTMNWDIVREAVAKHGMRNSNTMAIAPTATIANITGVIPSNEPIYKHLFVKSNLSGEFTIVNPYLIETLKRLNLWDDEMIDDLKYFDGSIREIERIPAAVRQLFLTAFEIEPDWVLECAARRQKWIDMGQSLNLYLAEPSGKKLHQMYLSSWEKGLKTNYYLRTLAATQIEKSTMDINRRGLQPKWMKNKSASSQIEVTREETKPQACNLGEACESCQ